MTHDRLDMEVHASGLMNIAMLGKMRHSPVRNYVVPGLTSWLIGGEPSAKGCIRLFESSRETREFITPHSHRFDFSCFVLRGWVKNRVFRRTDERNKEFPGDKFIEMKLNPAQGGLGKYVVLNAQPGSTGVRMYGVDEQTYNAGESYGMAHHEIHSIVFSRDALVVFFEGPQTTEQTLILEPWVNGERIPTFKVEDWMFLRGDA